MKKSITIMMLAFSLSLSAQALTDVTSNNAASYLQKKQSSIELEYEAEICSSVIGKLILAVTGYLLPVNYY